MMKDFARLAKRIRTAVDDLENVVARCEKALARSKTSADDLYLDSVALNLEGFYSGLERLLQLIATTIDGKLPHGAEWHKELLDQMCTEIPGVRPAVFSEKAKAMLETYRSLRHVVRVIYTFKLEPEKLEEHTRALRPTLIVVRQELGAFATLLEQRARDTAE